MKRILMLVSCTILICGCTTYRFYYDGDKSNYSEYSIDVNAAEGQRELSLNEAKIELVKANEDVSSDKKTTTRTYSYIGENGDTESAVIVGNTYKLTYPDSPPAYMSKKVITISDSKRSIASNVRESAQEKAYVNFVWDKNYAFSKYFVALDDKDRVVKSKNAPTAIFVALDGEEVGYIIPGKEPKVLFRNDRELPSDLYFLSLVVYESFVNN
jgi:hypothetical protein